MQAEPSVAEYVPLEQRAHPAVEVVGEEDDEEDEDLPAGHREHSLLVVAVQADLK